MNKTIEFSFDRILMGGITDMVFVINVENESVFSYDFLNRTTMEGTGLTEIVLGKTIRGVYPREMANRLNKQYKKVVTSGENVTYTDSYITPSGDRNYSETILTPFI